MLYFLFQILINAIAVVVTILLIPGASVGRVAGIYEWLVAGLAFGLLNAFVRPVIVMFTGRLLIRTFGLFLIVINAILLWILAWLFQWQVESPLWLLFGGLVIGLLLALLDALFGLHRPLLSETDENSRLWRVLVRFSGNRSNQLVANLRLQQVYDIIYRFALEIGLDRVPIVGAIRERVGKVIFKNDRSAIAGLTTPAQVRVMLQTLGPTFVKFGQMVSSRAEALPPDWQSELAKLQSNVPPFPTEEAIQIIEAELKKPIAQLFTVFGTEPFAAASTAQVHKATLPTGESIVIKVQRPNIVPKIKADLEILGELLAALSNRFTWMYDNNILGIFQEFAKNLVEELDYRTESFNARRLADNMAVFPEVKVPKMYSHLTTAKVLTMEYVEGVKIIKTETIAGAGWDLSLLGHNFLRVMIKQIVFDGYFHGDCHPGNVLCSLGNGQIIFLDLGMMGTLNQEQRMNLADLIWTLNGGDSYELSEALLRLCTPFKEVFVDQFRQDIELVVVRYLKYPDEAGSLSGVLNGVFAMLAKNGLRLGHELTMALKTLVQAEQIVHTVDPMLDITKESFVDIQGFLADQFTKEKVQQTVQTQLLRTTKELVRRIPDLQTATMQWIGQYEKGKFELELNTDDLNQRLDVFNRAAQRLAIGIVLLGMVIGSAFATGIDGSILGIPLSWIAFGLFGIAMIVSTLMLWNMVQELRRKPQPPARIRY